MRHLHYIMPTLLVLWFVDQWLSHDRRVGWERNAMRGYEWRWTKADGRTVLVLGSSTTADWLGANYLAPLLDVSPNQVLDAHVNGCHQDCSHAIVRRAAREDRHFALTLVGINQFQQCDDLHPKRILQQHTLLPTRDVPRALALHAHGEQPLLAAGRLLGNALSGAYGDTLFLQSEWREELLGKPDPARAYRWYTTLPPPKRPPPFCDYAPERVAYKLAVTAAMLDDLGELSDDVVVVLLPDVSLSQLDDPVRAARVAGPPRGAPRARGPAPLRHPHRPQRGRRESTGRFHRRVPRQPARQASPARAVRARARRRGAAMSFTSPAFIVFFLLFFWLWPGLRGRPRQLFLLGASYLFYASWSAPLLLLLDRLDPARLLRRPRHRRQRGPRPPPPTPGRLASWATSGCSGSSSTTGSSSTPPPPGCTRSASTWAPPTLSIVLPVGISFYTFQTLGYTIDVYRRHLAPCTSLLDFALYVAYFPQLVAGPIERAGHLVPQLQRLADPQPPRAELSGWGLIALGAFKKVVIADNLAPLVDGVYADPSHALAPALWLATSPSPFQIYCDFSGYSDIARGVARLMGVLAHASTSARPTSALGRRPSCGSGGT
jgi:hypothetical protein